MIRGYQKIVLIAALLYNGLASASQFDGKIREVWMNAVGHENVGWIRVEGNIASPSCPNSEWFILDMAKADMKVAFSVALTAYTAERTVRLGGTGTCLGNYEWLKYIAIR